MCHCWRGAQQQQRLVWVRAPTGRTYYGEKRLFTILLREKTHCTELINAAQNKSVKAIF